MIELNITVWIQLANFLITLVVLNYLLIRPILSIIRARKEKVAGLVSDIDTFADRSRELLADYEVQLAQARAAANARRKEMKAEAETEERALLAEATKEAQAQLRSSQEAVREEAEKARRALQGEMKSFVTAAVAKLVG